RQSRLLCGRDDGAGDAASLLLEPVDDVPGDDDAAGDDRARRGHRARPDEDLRALVALAAAERTDLIEIHRHRFRLDVAVLVVHRGGARYIDASGQRGAKHWNESHLRRRPPASGKTMRLARKTRWYQAGNFAQSEMCTGMNIASSRMTSAQVAIGLRRLIQPVVIPAASEASAPRMSRAISMRSVKSICFSTAA